MNGNCGCGTGMEEAVAVAVEIVLWEKAVLIVKTAMPKAKAIGDVFMN